MAENSNTDPPVATSTTVFVTVGTTKFDALVRAVCSPAARRTLRAQGFDRLLVQIGAGSYEPDVVAAAGDVPGLAVHYFRFQPSLDVHLAGAGLVIGHAGAGTMLGALDAGRRVVAVVNDALMGNHQLELAEKMASDGHVLACSCDSLVRTLEEELPRAEFVPWTPGRPGRFATFLDAVMGVKKLE